MKRITKGDEPELLAAYRTDHPHNTWTQCKNSRGRREQIQNRLRHDQGGLCAYCEIDLKAEDATGTADFRVEHFHPKSDKSTPHNWHLDWQNLLGCCHGGSQADVVNAADRASSPDHSCDVPKGANNWDTVILNPLDIPASPCLFTFDRSTGNISISEDNCHVAGVDIVKANNTIIKLHLDAQRLNRLRKAELDRVNDHLRALVGNGMAIDMARKKIAKNLMRKDADGCWPNFFSALRVYLGNAAENQLALNGY